MAYPNIVPLGALAVSAAGTTVLLSKNCAPLAGQVSGTQASPNQAGTALRQIQIFNPAASGGAIGYLLPRGKTFSANPEAVIAVIMPGATISLPNGVMAANGLLPENFCLDASATLTMYGCGFTG